jgi:hypothetical protein
MTSADLDHNDEHAARKNRKLDWVTPRLTLMGAEDTEGSGKPPLFTEDVNYGNPLGPS